MDAQQMLKDLALSETGFVFDPRSGATFTANSTGLAILAGLRDGKDRDGILDDLARSFEIQGETRDLRRDLDEFVHLLRSHGLLPADFSW